MDVEKITDGAFLPRVTADGEPTAFNTDGRRFDILRGASVQTIEIDSMLGAVALCRADGTVLGYGRCDIIHLPAFADRLDEAYGAHPGTPLERIAAHGIVLAMPLDDMPKPVRDAFLAAQVDPKLLEMTGLTGDAIEDAKRAVDEIAKQAGHGHGQQHDHAPAAVAVPQSDRQTMETIRHDIDLIVETHGHGCISTNAKGVDRCYTVGLADGGWPDLIITGLGPNGMNVLNEVVGAIRKRDRRPEDATELHGIIDVPLRLRALPDDALNWASVATERMHRKGQPFAGLMQVEWPDADGHFPGEKGYDDKNLPQFRIGIDG